MSEIKGCMNCGNISCGNNKKRESAGCGRYISPEDKIKELEKEAEEYADWFWGASPSMMKALARAYIKGAEPREKRIAELEAQIEKMKSQYDYAFTQLLESREIVCLMLSQYRNKKEINYSTRERGEKLLKQGVYKHD